MKKFKKGDKVIFNGLSKDVNSSWIRWAKEDNLIVGNVYTIKYDSESINLEGVFFGYHAEWFSLLEIPTRIVIILRRGADDRSVRKALEELGTLWGNGDLPTKLSTFDKNNCRALIIYTGSNTMYWSSAYGKYDGAKRIREKEKRVGNPLILNTKPSVKETINELKKYLS